jgi:L-asparaginase II
MKNLYDRLDSFGIAKNVDGAEWPEPRQWPAHVPIAVRLRGSVVENVHHGTVVGVGTDGSIAFAAGDPDAPTYARSALKPLQTLAMVRHGLDVDDELLAVASASHSGEAGHLNAVSRLLRSFGLGEDHLRNVAALPYDPSERAAWLRAGRTESRLAQNCSGKHAAMVATCTINDWPTEAYLDVEHPLQQAIRTTVEEVTGEQVHSTSVDGCGAPLFATTLSAVARAYGRLASAPPGTSEARIARAMSEHPTMVAGHRRDVTSAMRAVPGAIFKDGAAGVQLVGLPDGRAVAVKVGDGDPEARMPVTVRALQYLGVGGTDLDEMGTLPTRGGTQVVGELRALDFLASSAITDR